MDNDTRSVFKWLGLGVFTVFLFGFLNPIVFVGTGERGVVTNFGAVQDGILNEGVHLRIPFVQRVIKIDVQTQKEQVDAMAASKDLQNVSAKVALNFHLDPNKVNNLYQQIGANYKERIIDPSVQEAVKAITAKYTAEELITKREQVKQEAKQLLFDRLSKDYIIVDELSIVNFDFSTSFNQAIESKVTAEQNALAAKNKLEQVKFEADQRLAQAEAEAKSIRLQSDAANNDKYVRLKELEVRLEMAKKWDGKLPQNLYASVPIPFLEIDK